MAASSTVTESELGGPPTPTTSIFPDSASHNRVLDPNTFEGQQIGALLSIKRTRTNGREMDSQVGDVVRVLKHAHVVAEVYNIRINITEGLHWAQFFPLQVGDECYCAFRRCSCIKADPMAYAEYILGRQKERTAQTGKKDEPPKQETSKVLDPNTPEGQQPGAILVIKHRPPFSSHQDRDEVQVGDFIQTISFSADSKKVTVKNLRTHIQVEIFWASVFPVGGHDICECQYFSAAKCRCVYLDFKKSTGRDG